MINLTFLSWWVYALHVVANPTTGFGSPMAGGQVTANGGFFISVRYMAAQSLWATHAGNLRIRRTCPGLPTYMTRPPYLVVGSGENLTVLTGVCHDYT